MAQIIAAEMSPEQAEESKLDSEGTMTKSVMCKNIQILNQNGKYPVIIIAEKRSNGFCLG